VPRSWRGKEKRVFTLSKKRKRSSTSLNNAIKVKKKKIEASGREEEGGERAISR